MKNIVHLCRNQWDRSAGLALTLVGFAAIGIAWLKARRSLFAFEQIPLMISGGIVGLGLIAVGIGLWVSADLRDTWRKLDDIDETLGRNQAITIGSPLHLDVRDRVPAGEN